MSNSKQEDVQTELLRLREENARLKSLLIAHHIPLSEREFNDESNHASNTTALTDSEKLDLAG